MWMGDDGYGGKPLSLSRGFIVHKACRPLGGHPGEPLVPAASNASQALNDPFDSGSFRFRMETKPSTDHWQRPTVPFPTQINVLFHLYQNHCPRDLLPYGGDGNWPTSASSPLFLERLCHRLLFLDLQIAFECLCGSCLAFPCPISRVLMSKEPNARMISTNTSTF